MKILDWNNITKGFFRINGFLKDKDISHIYDLNSDKKIKNEATQNKKILKKILNRNDSVNKVSLIIQIRPINLYAYIDDIYRIEILDNDGNIIDSINTHQEGVPLEIREEFDKEFRK